MLVGGDVIMVMPILILIMFVVLGFIFWINGTFKEISDEKCERLKYYLTQQWMESFTFGLFSPPFSVEEKIPSSELSMFEMHQQLIKLSISLRIGNYAIMAEYVKYYVGKYPPTQSDLKVLYRYVSEISSDNVIIDFYRRFINVAMVD